MNKLHHLPADTPSSCFSDLLHCLLCGGTVSTRSTTSTPHSTSISTKFVDLLQNDETVSNLPDQQASVSLRVPIVARLMGLETPVDMSWVPRKVRVDDSFNRSKSVNSVDYLLHFDPKATPLHRRVKTSLSFREVPVGDFLVVCSERNAQCDKKRAEDAHKDQPEAKTEGWKKEGRTTRDGRRASASTKSNIQLGHAKQIMTARQSSSRIATNSEQSVRRKIGPSCQRSGKENSHITARNALSNWQQKNDYYCKRQGTKSHLGRSKASSKSKSKLLRKDVNSDRECVSATRNHRRKTSTVNMSVTRKLQREERRRSRKSNNEDRGTETFGTMIKKMKRLVEQDLEMKRWSRRCEAELGYLSLEIEVGILDGLLNQMVHDLASKWDV